MYAKHLPDYGNLDNSEGKYPGYRVYVFENDGGISLQMMHTEEDPSTGEVKTVFVNIKEAEDLIEVLQAAIDIANPKKANHKSREKHC